MAAPAVRITPSASDGRASERCIVGLRGRLAAILDPSRRGGQSGRQPRPAAAGPDSDDGAYALTSDLAHDLVETLVDRQATDVVLLDLSQLSAFADQFVIASVDNVRQSRAVIDAIDEHVRERGGRRVRPEGDPSTGWVLLDVGSGVVVHIFSVEARARYDLEGLWSRAQEVVRVQ